MHYVTAYSPLFNKSGKLIKTFFVNNTFCFLPLSTDLAISRWERVEARLQLAAIYASTDSEVPYIRSRQTGGEIAIELLRQSWVNRPLQGQENEHLDSMANFTRFSYC